MDFPTERRRVQRVRLPQPLRATIDGARALIVDLSLRGLRVVHQEPPAHTCLIRAAWQGMPLELQCEIAHTAMHRSPEFGGRMLHHTGLMIRGAAAESQATLRRIVEHHVERALDEQKANARGVPPPLAAQSTPTGAPSAFVRHEYVRGRWREVMTASAVQPDNGFTIAADTAPAEVDMLRRAYEHATTAADVAVIRKLAAMSVSAAEIVPARRYTP